MFFKRSYLMDFVLKQSVIDQTRIELLQAVKQLQVKRGLNTFDMENVLYQVLTDIKIEKETLYSTAIIRLTNQVRQMEKEKKEQAQEQALQIKKEE